MNKNEELQRIARYLMLHASHQKNLGLMNGKIGLSIFFFHLSQYTNNKLYSMFAEELISEIYKEIHHKINIDFENGLSGIAWGIEYLIQNKFIKGDSNEVLEDLDRKIIEWDVRCIQDTTLNTGLIGIAYYVISRCANNNNNIFSKEYITELINALKSNMENNTTNAKLIKDLEGILFNQNISLNNSFMYEVIRETTYRKQDLFKKYRSIGISDNGYAGVGFKIMQNEKENLYI